MNEDIEDFVLITAQIAATKVSFLETKEEYDLYVNALYEALIWGMKINANRSASKA